MGGGDAGVIFLEDCDDNDDVMEWREEDGEDVVGRGWTPTTHTKP